MMLKPQLDLICSGSQVGMREGEVETPNGDNPSVKQSGTEKWERGYSKLWSQGQCLLTYTRVPGH